MIAPLIEKAKRWYHRIMPEGYLTVKQVAARLEVHESRVKVLIQVGKLKAEKFGKRAWIIKEEDLAEFELLRNRKPGRPSKA